MVISSPHLLPVRPNLIIDLRSGIPRPRSIIDYFTIECPCIYNPYIPTDIAEKYMNSLLPEEDDKYRNFIHKVMGYCITGEYNNKLFIIKNKYNSNEKSALILLFHNILGNFIYNFFLVLMKSFDKRYRLFLCDFEHIQNINVNAEIISNYKLFLILNNNHYINIPEDIFQDKLIILPFENYFASNPYFNINEKDPSVISSFLNWLIEGAVLYYREGLTDIPNLINVEKEKYRKEMDYRTFYRRMFQKK